MSDRAAEAAIGAVVLAAAAAFAVYAAQASGIVPGRGLMPLNARFPSVEGIAVGTDVRLAGIKVGTVTAAQVEEIAKIKLPDLNCEGLDAAMRSVSGTARSMGLDILG